MKIIEISELGTLLDRDNLTSSLILEALRIHKIPLNVKWILTSKLKEESEMYAARQGWDIRDTLVLYGTKHDCMPGSYVCMFYQNMTIEKLAGLINQIPKLKAFL